MSVTVRPGSNFHAISGAGSQGLWPLYGESSGRKGLLTGTQGCVLWLGFSVGMLGFCVPVGVPAENSGTRSLGKGREFVKRWAGGADAPKDGAGPQPEATGEETHKGIWKQSCGFPSPRQPARDDPTRWEAGRRENNTCPRSPPSLGPPASGPHWSGLTGSQRAKTLVTHPGHPPSTQLRISGQSVLTHWDFDLYKSSRSQILMRPRYIMLDLVWYHTECS